MSKKVRIFAIRKEQETSIYQQLNQQVMKTNFKMSKCWSKAIVFLQIFIFMVGASAADGLADNGMMWLLILMLFVPMGVLAYMNKRGWLEWMKEGCMD